MAVTVFLLAFIIFLVILYLIYLLIERWRFVKLCSKIPGLKTSKPILGDLPFLVGRTNEKGFDFHTRFFASMVGVATQFQKEGIFCVWLSIHPTVAVFSAKTVERVVNNSTLISKAHDYDLLHDWLNTGLLTSTGEKWRKRRKLITPTFHYKILDEFIPSFDKNCKILINKLKKYTDEEWIDTVHVITLCTLDIIIGTAMGIELNAQEDRGYEYMHALDEFDKITYAHASCCQKSLLIIGGNGAKATSGHTWEQFAKIFMERMAKFWLQNDFIFSFTSSGIRSRKTLRVLKDLTSKVIKEKKREFLKKKALAIQENIISQEEVYGKKKKPLLDLLIEQQLIDSSLTDADIAEEVDTFMFAGHDTTALGISWALFHLGLHPEMQQKVYQELYEIFGDDKESEITMEELRRMKYLECFLKESQRVTPSVPMISRSCSQDTVINGYTIPRGATIGIFIYALHHNPEFFPNPEIFDPDRFLPENCVGRDPFAFIPFSAGPRNCIGQKYAMLEMKTIISNILRNFVLETIGTLDEIRMTALLVLRPKDKLRIKIRKRL